MKVTLVPKPVPSDAVIQMQKNAILRKISQLENSPDQMDRVKAVQLKQQLEEIEKKRQEQKELEKKELLQVEIKYKERKKMLDDIKVKEDEKKEHLRELNEQNEEKRRFLYLRWRLDKKC